MKWVRTLLLAGLFLVVMVRWPANFTAWGVTPAWPFLLVLLLGLRARVQPAVVLSWCTGLLVDLLSLSPLGVHAFLFGLAALVLVRVRGHLFASHPGGMQRRTSSDSRNVASVLLSMPSPRRQTDT